MTWLIAPMRDAEERSGYTPQLRWDVRPKGVRPFVPWLWNSATSTYGWLTWPHRVLSIAVWFALGLGAFNLARWLLQPVYLPAP